MANWWLNRIVVRGLAADVAALRSAARASHAGQYLTVATHSTRLQLSFERLNSMLPAHAAISPDLLPSDPLDLVVDPIEKLKPNMVELTYKFLLNDGDPKPLLIELSRIYPRLCFVLGWIDSNSEDRASCFIHKGRSNAWVLFKSSVKTIFAGVPELTEENEDEVSFAEDAAEWAMMDAVIDHWDEKSERTLAMIGAGDNVCRKARKRPRSKRAKRR